MGKIEELIILGNGPSRTKCKYHCETWGVNGGYAFAKRLDKLFMMDYLGDEVLEEEYNIEKLLQFNGTLVLTDHFKVFDGLSLPVEIYPINEVIARFNTKYFSNTIAYMLARALLYTKSIQGPDDPLPKVVEGYNPIYFYGIDMMTHTTYSQEKGGVEFWMGIALAMGVEIVNTSDSATGKTWDGKMYGAYGLLEEEMLKDPLNLPWDIVPADKTPSYHGIEFEYKEIDGDWVSVPMKQ